ncbi:elongation factor G [Thermanaerosceptrum fracticalcis]|uniref:Elongation factor G n=1 Tax=Thermanaerosceptrum fracticalcis TaxID=1712410 RepID=A0A7G6E136_THEFR|nr:elongation factor G [Thermanaerosceptrum fracticalcis]QNB45790.1 elongation factor G [Thermanaerosceptrum fracticalcis]
MRTYDSKKLRNVGILAHGGAGKTSLTEAILFNAGHTTRLGKVDDGNTVTDYLPEEIKRKVTVSTTLAPVEWKDTKINILDTPGYADFIGEVKSAMRAIDSIIMVVCGASGVEVQTEVHWDAAEEAKIPRLAFINKLDRENSNFYRVLDDMQQRFGNHVVPIMLPIGAEDSFAGVVDILKQKAYKFDGNKVKEEPIPDNLKTEVEKYREALMEAAAEGDDELLMKYLEGEPLTDEEIYTGLKAGVMNAKVVPVFCGSALKNIGIQPLMDAVLELLPSPVDHAEGKDLTKEPLAAIVFKTLADPFVGKLSFVKVVSGILKGDSTVYNVNKEKEERFGSLMVMRGKNQDTVTEAYPGDIVAIAKLAVTVTGDTLGIKDKTPILPGVNFPAPTYSVAVEAKSRNDEDKVGNALYRLLEEDPTLRLEKNTETKQTILTGMGEQHLDIIMERLQRKFGVEVNLSTPRVPYRETIRGTAEYEYKHKKQSGGHGQYGHVKLRFEPLPDKEFEFAETIFGGAVPKNYHPAVEKGVREAMVEGILAGYPVTNIKVTLYDGSYHEVDSSEMSFKIAANMAFKKGVEKARPVLMEPIMNVEVYVPEQFMGDIISDLNGKRGRIMGMEPKGKWQVVKAQVPLSEMYRYAIDLKSITQGRGHFKMEFSHYEDVPQQIAKEIIEEAMRNQEKTS